MKYLILILIFLQIHICLSEHFTFYGITRECEKDGKLESALVYSGESLYIDNDGWIHILGLGRR